MNDRPVHKVLKEEARTWVAVLLILLIYMVLK
jgi:hypothetical protein